MDMEPVNLRTLPSYQPRKFVPQAAVLTDKDQVVTLLRHLLERPVSSKEELELWILDSSEFGAALSQAGTILYIEMTCHTDDPAKSSAYQKFVEEIEPVVKPLGHALNNRFLELIGKFPLTVQRYEVMTRASRAEVALFVEKNIPLQTEIALLSHEYQVVSGAMTVDFEGKEHTLPEMGKFLLESARDLRERAWRATAERRLNDKDRLEAIFDKMRVLRDTIARNAGFLNFRDYQFKAYHRFDYSPEDCKTFHRSVRELIVPIRREMDEFRRKQMKLASLRPWDTVVDPLDRPALKPFDSVEKLQDGVSKIVDRLDPQLSGFYADMRSLGLLDLASRKGKAPGGYQNSLNEVRKPFIFMNAVGMDDDVRTLLHESGHAFHSYLCVAEPLVEYRHAPMEFCEVASMSMELMCDRFMIAFYSPQEARRSSIEFLDGIIATLASVATVDAFQHWLYENPQHNAEERRLAWLRLQEEFSGGVVDWSGLEEIRSSLWHRHLHIFEVPFYYIEYGIAQLGALQIWQQFKKDPAKAVANYKRGLALGGSRPLPELFAASGIRFDFSREMIAPLVEEVYGEWKRLTEKP
jgi:oligoendopeptidase F